ncbi:MAG: Gfo/Idh/MocA family oxidoreductase [Candidatus Sumerlaeota bacterium]|nr:Gfo/Idh/MocA family oxidoreductase [Candidatus Sumerlaeota bacterium]
MKTKKTVRCGIAGAGFSASFHYEAVQKVYGTNVEVRGVFAIDAPQAKAYAEKRGIKCFDTLDAMLDEVDVVHVCVTATSHESVALEALKRDRFAIVEKPLTGYFGDGTDSFNGDTCSREKAREEALASIDRMIAAEKKSKGKILYAENWVYAPSVQKEREIIEKTGAQILWIHAEESHSGSHAASYAQWKFSGGGVMIGKGVHPLTAALYLKRIEGIARNGKPIQPSTVSARVHALTRMKTFRDEGHIRSNYHDIDDFSMMHVVFEDGTIANVFASDIILGGIHNYVERTITAPSATSTPTRRWPLIIPWRRTSRTFTSSRRSEPSRAGRILRPTRIGSPATRRRSRRSIARSHTANRSRATRTWRPTASRQSTAPTSPPNAKAPKPRSRFIRRLHLFMSRYVFTPTIEARKRRLMRMGGAPAFGVRLLAAAFASIFY